MIDRSLLAMVLTTATSLAIRSAHAADVDEGKVRCKSSYESAQVLKREESFEAARKQLRACRETCPAPLVRECVAWESELDVLMPTVRFALRDSAGAAVTDARVTIDGRTLAPIDVPVSLDPGAHTFRFEPRTGSSVETRVVIHAGERDHVVSAVLPPASVGASSAASSGASSSRWPSYVLGGIGGAALLGAGVLAIKGHVDRSDLRSGCAPHCDEADVDAIRTLWWVSAGMGAAGVLSFAAAIVLWPRASGEHLSVGFAPNGVALRWQTR